MANSGLIEMVCGVKPLRMLFHSPVPRCSDCWKPESLCLCDSLSPFSIKKKLLILQHPSEAKDPKGSARLLSLMVSNSVHRVGLSWKSLSHALGSPADPRKWGVLFVGTKKGVEKPVREYKNMEGLVLLDGTWKQSKTLWWRNPWVLKLNRMVLTPNEPSQYGQLRRSPRRIYLSTLEAAADALILLGEPESVRQSLHRHFAMFVNQLGSVVDPPSAHL